MERAESQGHRLSSYASSSSNKHSPKTPKKTDKLQSFSAKVDSLSPRHLLTCCSHSNINSQLIDQHFEYDKYTCNNSSYSSLKSLKSNALNSNEKFQKVKTSCDAATSPGRLSQNNLPTGNQCTKLKLSTCSELRISDDKKIINKLNPSPKRLVATRNAATSPNLDLRKLSQKQCEFFGKNADVSLKGVLEKSNSLGGGKPNRQLKTTRSLSPRPPVRHQHSIMVSDENDIVSVKVSPNEDFDINNEEKRVIEHISSSNLLGSGTMKKHKAQSEQTSPNLSDFDTMFCYDKTNNKSTGCLVYVPSDPWLKMTDVDKKENFEKFNKNKLKLSQETRSLSRGNLPLDNKDPWIWRKLNDENNLSPKGALKPSPKQEKYRQTKSFSSTKFEVNDFEKNSGIIIDSDNCAKISTNRPKLQRCKSPIVIDDDLTLSSFSEDFRKSCKCNDSQNLLSPRKELNVNEKSTNNLTVQQNKMFLNVINPNLIQSRHSFSSISQKNEELQLNIRRLSEQIKQTDQTSGSGSDFTDYLNKCKLNGTKKSKVNNSTKTDTEPVLETTC